MNSSSVIINTSIIYVGWEIVDVNYIEGVTIYHEFIEKRESKPNNKKGFNAQRIQR